MMRSKQQHSIVFLDLIESLSLWLFTFLDFMTLLEFLLHTWLLLPDFLLLISSSLVPSQQDFHNSLLFALCRYSWVMTSGTSLRLTAAKFVSLSLSQSSKCVYLIPYYQALCCLPPRASIFISCPALALEDCAFCLYLHLLFLAPSTLCPALRPSWPTANPSRVHLLRPHCFPKATSNTQPSNLQVPYLELGFLSRYFYSTRY